MGGINLNESGLDFVRQVFVTFGGNTTVLTLFLLSVLYLALKGKKEERYVFVTTAVFSGLYGIQSICGEIYPGKTWNGQCLLPVFLDSADGTDHRICLHESCGRAEKRLETVSDRGCAGSGHLFWRKFRTGWRTAEAAG